MGILTGVCLLVAQGAEAAPTLAELARAKLAAARTTYEATVATYQTGRIDADAAYRWSCRWLDAERDVAEAELWLARAKAP
jgi:hypothetical protein